MKTKLIKTYCRYCLGGIEFPKEGKGQTVECPHCHQSVKLTHPSWTVSLRRMGFRFNWPVAVTVSSILICSTAWGLFSLAQSEAKKRNAAILANQQAHNEEMERIQRSQMEAMIQQHRLDRSQAESQAASLRLQHNLDKAEEDYKEAQRKSDIAIENLNRDSKQRNNDWYMEEANRINQQRLWNEQRAASELQHKVDRANQINEDRLNAQRLWRIQHP